jgi:hypothetical protein
MLVENDYILCTHRKCDYLILKQKVWEIISSKILLTHQMALQRDFCFTNQRQPHSMLTRNSRNNSASEQDALLLFIQSVQCSLINWS